ncbi:MAG: class I SAM-dependent methyltransferase [Minisyncoccia bacterium]
MKYYTSEELRGQNQAEARNILEKCSGPFVRYNFGINIFKHWFNKEFDSDPDVKTLDLGSASGAFEAQLKDIGYSNVYGLDIDDYRLPKNKEFFKDFKTADLGWDKIPWPDNHFQIVTGWCILPHLENPFHCVREIHRILAPGGIFIFSVPHVTAKHSIDYLSQKKDFGSYRATNNHLVIFTPAVINKAILKYFDLLNTEFAVRTAKIFKRGLQGKLRKILYFGAEKISPKLKRKIDERWAYDVIYIVRKK